MGVLAGLSPEMTGLAGSAGFLGNGGGADDPDEADAEAAVDGTEAFFNAAALARAMLASRSRVKVVFFFFLVFFFRRFFLVLTSVSA